MSHGHAMHYDVEGLIDAEPIQARPTLRMLLWGCVLVGCITFLIGLLAVPPQLFWGAYLVNVLFFMGLSAGMVITAAIFQIVRATWAVPVRRIGEAGISFLPWAYALWFCTYFGKQYIYPWAKGPMPGREWWMQPDFVYARFTILFFILFYFMWRYVKLSLRSDVGFLREQVRTGQRWRGWFYRLMVQNWKGSEVEINKIQRTMSVRAPVLIIVYAVVYSLFSFEMIMAVDPVWYSNLFGAFNFVGNVYVGWATIALIAAYLISHDENYSRNISPNQLWDLGKLEFGFCMLWGYMFFSQFLPVWYGNMPEETTWWIARLRTNWMPVCYAVFAMCFVMPFIWLLSDYLKRVPQTLAVVSMVIFLGIWLEKYVVVMPAISPDFVPVLGGGIVEVGLFFGFLGAFGLSIQSFLKAFPVIPLSHPQVKGIDNW